MPGASGTRVLAAVPREPAGPGRPTRRRRLGNGARRRQRQANRARRGVLLRRRDRHVWRVPVPSRSEEDSVALLLAKKVDYVLMDELVVQYILENHPNEARTKLSVGTTPLLKRALHLAVRRSHPDADAIVERFNAQLRGMIADRTYHRLLNVSWILADVDGDGVTELVPKSDLSGREAPKQAGSLFSTDAAEHEVDPDGAALLRRRHHLHGLGSRAEPLQIPAPEPAGLRQPDRQHLHVPVVTSGSPALSSAGAASGKIRAPTRQRLPWDRPRCNGSPAVCARAFLRWPRRAAPPPRGRRSRPPLPSRSRRLRVAAFSTRRTRRSTRRGRR